MESMRPDTKHLDWSFADFTSEIGEANRIGLANLSHAELLGICAGTQRHFKYHFWVDVRPFFLELWRRIEEKRMPEAPTKTEACRLIGCSLRWAEIIVSGTAKNKTRVACAHTNASSRTVKLRTNNEYVADIRSYADRKLKVLWVRGEFERYRNICGLLSEHFADAVGIDHIDDVNRTSDSVQQGDAAP